MERFTGHNLKAALRFLNMSYEGLARASGRSLWTIQAYVSDRARIPEEFHMFVDDLMHGRRTIPDNCRRKRRTREQMADYHRQRIAKIEQGLKW